MSSKVASGSITNKKLQDTRILDKKRKSASCNDTRGESRKTVPEGPNSRRLNEKKPKLHSPFRIKVGCVVALRFRPQGNHVELSPSVTKRKREQTRTIQFDENYYQSWVDPVPGRDERLSLIGKRIRCFFPKKEGKDQRILEGEVINVFSENGINSMESFQVELLIEKNLLTSFRFLVRTDADVDVSKFQNENAKRNYLLEEKIKGRNKASVKMTLESPSMFGVTGKDTVRWVLLKRIPPKLFHAASNVNSSMEAGKKLDDTEDIKESNKKIKKKNPEQTDASQTKNRKGNGSRTSPPNVVTRNCGDGNDSSNQQILNWRWLASRYYDLAMSSSLDLSITSSDSSFALFITTIIASGLVGRVLKVEPKKNENSLAIVTIKRLLLPEQTISGRLPLHTTLELLEPHDKICDEVGELFEILVPVEHLIVLSQSDPISSKDNYEDSSSHLIQSYSIRKDLYLPIPNQEKQTTSEDDAVDSNTSLIDDGMSLTFCHRCRKHSDNLRICSKSKECRLYNPGIGPARWCFNCIQTLFHGTDYEDDCSSPEDTCDFDLPCCLGFCDCRSCSYNLGLELQLDLTSLISDTFKGEQYKSLNKGSSLHALASSLDSVDCANFCLPTDFLGLNSLPIPRAKMITKIKARSLKRPANAKILRSKKFLEKINSAVNKIDVNEKVIAGEDYSVFKPSCSRVDTTYNAEHSSQKNVCTDLFTTNISYNSVVRNAREITVANGSTSKSLESEKEIEKISTNRAARANQRRLMKDVASFGYATASSMGLLDSLANREAKLRFDRSSIHAWGVFADEPIAADEMVLEYRGELIGNGMAEKREKEYDVAKIGSDYMFRIDSDVVCDATKQGNVARFINASCDPNCYTKIIPLDGNKRIVIYAKREINVGEELCYDYKFPLEYDEKKRIPCHCGAKDCRGFMNWVRNNICLSEFCLQSLTILFFVAG